MVLVVNQEVSQRILNDSHGTNRAYLIGEVAEGEGVRFL